MSLEELQLIDKADRDNSIGTYLYNKIEAKEGGEIAGKITGMLLDLELSDVYNIIHDEPSFDKVFNEALELIRSEQ